MRHTLSPALATAWAAFSLLGAAPASAQTLGYTAKELAPPFTYTIPRCEFVTRHSLGDNGTVASLCTYVAGFYFAPQVGVFFPIPYPAHRPIAWRNNGASVGTLPLPAGFEIKYDPYGVDAKGRILARIGPIQKPGSGYDYAQESLVWWDGNTRSTWSPPIEGLKDVFQWRLGNVTPQGKVPAFTLRKGAQQGGRIVVIDGDSVRDLPLPPDLISNPDGVYVLGSLSGQNIFMNDQGQLVMLTRPREGQIAKPDVRAWFWNGQSWREITPGGTPFSMTLQLENITAKGDVMLTDFVYSESGSSDIRRYIWSETGGLKALASESTTDYKTVAQQVLEDGNTVAGQAQFALTSKHPRPGRNRAALFRDGRVIDLNSIVPPPSGYVFHEVIDVNARGQLLVRMVNTDKQNYKPRLWLFTPK
jgi:hypothetical protein